MKYGYGGRVGGTQFDHRVINGVRTEEVEARIRSREILKEWEDSLPEGELDETTELFNLGSALARFGQPCEHME